MVSTSHITINHPIIAAKQSAAIDHISDGRFILNIVTGWVQPEIEMFGQPMLPTRIATPAPRNGSRSSSGCGPRTSSFDHEGRFYKIKKGYLAPKPIQYPYPAIMNAGASELGRHFAVKHCDLVFTVIRTGGLDECRAHVQAYHKLARETTAATSRSGRWSTSCRARPRKRRATSTTTTSTSRATGRRPRTWSRFSRWRPTSATCRRSGSSRCRRPSSRAGAGLPVVGTSEQVVDTLATLSKAGLDGVLVAFPRYEEGMRDFRDKTYPLLKQAGLRDFL